MPKDSRLPADVRNTGLDRGREAGFAERMGRDMKSAADLLARLARPADALPRTAPLDGAAPSAWDLEGLAARIASSAAKFLGAETIDPEADFFELGASSINAVELVALDRKSTRLNSSHLSVSRMPSSA